MNLMPAGRPLACNLVRTSHRIILPSSVCAAAKTNKQTGRLVIQREFFFYQLDSHFRRLVPTFAPAPQDRCRSCERD